MRLTDKIFTILLLSSRNLQINEPLQSVGNLTILLGTYVKHDLNPP